MGASRLRQDDHAGRDPACAHGQAGEYFDALPEQDQPRHILAGDFQTFKLHDLGERETASFPLKDLPGHVEAFGFVPGVQRRRFRDRDPANIKAAELVGFFANHLFRKSRVFGSIAAQTDFSYGEHPAFLAFLPRFVDGLHVRRIEVASSAGTWRQISG